MNILIADRLADFAIEELRKISTNVEYKPELTEDDISDHVADKEILIVRSTPVTSDTIQQAESLSLIIRAGSGVNTIDHKIASHHGIHVANCPGKNTDAVAELTMGLIIAVDRGIADATGDLRNDKWRKQYYSRAYGLKDRTLGLVGFGSIARAVAERAQAFDMDVIAWSRSLTDEKAARHQVRKCSSKNALAEEADIVSVHLAQHPDTEHFIDQEFFNMMKERAIFINTSRGGIVDTDALKKSIDEKKLRVGLDVFEEEPSSGDSSFGDSDLAQKITCTPHIGASTLQATEAIAEGVVEVVESYLKTGKPINTVNVRSKSAGQISLLVRHYNQVGILASVLNILRHEDVNVEEMENTIFEGGEAATCTMWLDSEPTPDMLNKLRNDEHIIQVTLQRN